MSESINHLLELVDEFPKRVRIDYDENADRVFCNNVLIALGKAAPEIRALMSTTPFSQLVVGGLPSTSFPLTQGEVSNIGTQGQILGTDHSGALEASVVGTVEVADRISDIGGTPTPADAILYDQHSELQPSIKPKSEKTATTTVRRRGNRQVPTSTPQPGHD